jgi:S-adenosylmethionine-dependent methyltransferase
MSPDDVSDIRKHYVGYADQEVGRLDRHPIEFNITMRHLRQHLPPSGRILEVGCATGRYSVALAKLGYEVTAVDLTPELVDLCSAYSAEEGVSDRVTTCVADGRDLSSVPGERFDAGLLMGPLYHLIERADRQRAIAEVVARLRRGARFFSSHISRYGALADIVKKIPEWIEEEAKVESYLSLGHEGSLHPRDGTFRGYFTTVDELPMLHEEMGITTLAIAATDPAGTAAEEAIRELPEGQRERWLDVFHRISTEPSFRGAWCHLLYIGRTN